MKSKKPTSNSPQKSMPQQIRIIGGMWRGRKLPVLDQPGLRPTGDRMRETLFNWLQGEILGQRFLDWFAGAGSLGFEAASRGAAEVVMMEKNPRVVDQLQANVQRLQAQSQVRVYQGDALALIDGQHQPFDGVFMDPPFGFFDLAALVGLLQQKQLLNHQAWLYMESPKGQNPPLPSAFSLYREKDQGAVTYRLWRYTHDA